MNKILMLALIWLGTDQLPAQSFDNFTSYSPTKSNRERITFNKTHPSFYASNDLTSFDSTNDSNTRTPVWKEIGYILAMETVFTGMSYLASRKNGDGHLITGGFDLFMGFAGLPNASLQKPGVKRTGYYIISAGFMAKSLYNFWYGRDHNTDARFLTNFIGFNVLVFTGYFLDTLD
ncbi:MAG: hypothetical protein AB7W47_05265 [Calditrichaceae bacterium]